MAKEAFVPNATISDTTEKTALSIDALTVTLCNQDMMKTGALTTQSTPDQTPLNKNHHHHPPSESPHQTPLKNHASLPNNKTVTPPRPQMESEKGDKRERNRSGKDSKTMLIEVYPDNFRRWTKSMTKSSKIFPCLQLPGAIWRHRLWKHRWRTKPLSRLLIFNGISNVAEG